MKAIDTSAGVMPVLFVPHGGGPMPLLNEANHRKLSAFLSSVSSTLPKPTAIIVITAHWEAPVVTISSGPAPGMLYDYSGFPPESYEFKYHAAGDPDLAQSVAKLLDKQGIKNRLDSSRDFDHGTFVPLMLMYPNADIPVVQISLIDSLDPAEHIALGQALALLREQGVLILGSGMSFHNMRAFFSPDASIKERSEEFDRWLSETLTSTDLNHNQQTNRLIDWTSAPEARFCHPREEHLLPLLVCYGAGSAHPLVTASVTASPATKIFSDFLFNTKISAFLWP